MVNNLIANNVDVERVQSVVSFSEDFLLCFFCRRSHLNSIPGVPGENVPDFGRMFLTLKYTDITQNTYIRS